MGHCSASGEAGYSGISFPDSATLSAPSVSLLYPFSQDRVFTEWWEPQARKRKEEGLTPVAVEQYDPKRQIVKRELVGEISLEKERDKLKKTIGTALFTK